MKKALSVLLVIVMLFSFAMLAACAKEEKAAGGTAGTETPAAGTETPAAGEGAGAADDLANTKPNERVPEKIEAGMKPLVVFCAPTLQDSFVISISDGFKADLEALGFSYAVQDAQGNQANMLDLMENAVQMQPAAIVVMAFADGLEDSCAAAEAAGTYVVVFGATPSYPTAGLVSLDMNESGYQVVKMASAWIDINYPDAGPGEIKAMMTANIGQQDNKDCKDGMDRGVAEDPRIDVVYVGYHEQNSVDEGFDFAQEAFTMDPNIRIALTFTPAGGYGINNYIVANYPDQLPEFGIFTRTVEETMVQLIQAGADNDGSCFRGSIPQGGEKIWDGALDCVKALLLEGAEYGYISYDPLYTMNNFGYEYDSRNA